MSRRSKRNKESIEKELHFFFVLKNETNGDIESATETMQNAYSSWQQHWDRLDNKECLITESEVLQMSQDKFNKKAIFVLQEFEGEAFDHLSKNRVSILGPRCILDCFPNDISIPLTVSPVYTIAMLGMHICISGVRQPELKRLSTLIGYMGGIHFDQLSAGCTHLVSNTVTSIKYGKAVEAKMKIMLPSWIDDVWEKSKQGYCTGDDEQFLKHVVPVFHDLTISSTSLPAKVRDKVKELVEKNGGKYSGTFQSDTTQILILEMTAVNSAKFRSATKFKKHCLTPNWIFDSVLAGSAIAMDQYLVTRPENFQNSTPTKIDASKLLDFNPDGTQLSDISSISNASRLTTVNETGTSNRGSVATTLSKTASSRTRSTSSRSSKVPEYMSQVDKIVISQVKKAGGFLDGCKIYLSGFNSEAKEKLIKVLNFAGATRFDDLNNQVTHVIVGEHSQNDLAIMTSKKLTSFLVTIDWVMESMKLKEPANEEHFVYKVNCEEVEEAPSPASKKAIKSLNNTFKRPAVPPKLDYNKLEASSSSSKTPINSNKTNRVLYFDKEEGEKEPEGELMSQYLNDHDVNGPPQPVSFSVASYQGVEINTENIAGMNFLLNKTVFLFAFSDIEEPTMVEDCEVAKAIIVNKNYSDVVDYIFTPIKLPNLPIPVKGKEIFNDLWMEVALDKNGIPEPCYYLNPLTYSENDPKPLLGQKVCISTYAEQERIYIAALAEILGAEVHDTFDKKQKPILVCPRPEGTKYKAAKKWKLNVVTKDWLLKCYETKTMVKMDRYFVDNLERTITNVEEQISSADLRMIPALAPSTTADEIDLGGATLTPGMEKSISEMTSPELSRYTKNIIEQEKLASQKIREEFENNEVVVPDYILPHKRLNELKNNSINSPVASPSNVSANVNRLDLDTPTRALLKNVLKDYENAETPQTKRMKRTKDDKIKTPDYPETPDVDLGWNANCSRHTRAAQKRKLDVLDAYYLPAEKKERRKSTPLSEIKKQIYKTFLPDDSEEIGFLLKPTTPLVAQPSSSSSFQKLLDEASPKQSPTKQDKVDNQNLDELNTGDVMLQDFAKFVKNNIQSKKTPEKQTVLLDSEPLEPYNKELFHPESQQHEVGWVETREHLHQKKKFMYTTMSDDDKEILATNVSKIGGENLYNHGFDHSCTHLIVGKPSRSEKVISAIASGTWILNPKYIEDSVAAGKFLDEEKYEWGNPKCERQVPLNPLEQSIADAGYKWRQKLSLSSEIGAFSKFKVLFYPNLKKEAFARMIQAGKGTVLELPGPPFSDQKGVHQATHCFVDKKNSFSGNEESDLRKLQSMDIQVVTFNYLSSYLTDDHTNLSKHYVVFK